MKQKTKQINKPIFLTLCIPLFLGIQLCFSQENSTNVNYNGSFRNLPDGIIKQELSSFVKMAINDNFSSRVKINLVEYPIYNCSDYHLNVHQNKPQRYIYIESTLFDSTKHHLTFSDDSQSKLKLIDGKPFWGTGKIPKKEITKISYIHIKAQTLIPLSEFKDLYEPMFCTYKKKKRVRKESRPTRNITERFSRVFGSDDYKRVYIYMLNGEGAARYEVTFIIQDGKYYGRVIDSSPDSAAF